MPLIEQGFTLLEEAVIAAICEKHPADRTALEAQFSAAIVSTRENTGAGFCTYFNIDRESTPGIEGARLRNGPEVRVGALQHGMGFILWLEDGYASCLEGYTYGENTAAVDLLAAEFEIVRS